MLISVLTSCRDAKISFQQLNSQGLLLGSWAEPSISDWLCTLKAVVGAYWRTINAGERKKLMVEKVRRLEEVVRACKHRAR